MEPARAQIGTYLFNNCLPHRQPNHDSVGLLAYADLQLRRLLRLCLLRSTTKRLQLQWLPSITSVISQKTPKSFGLLAPLHRKLRSCRQNQWKSTVFSSPLSDSKRHLQL
ncbi:hypothetical protein U1Q18_025127 [Sarracenia purpurea var. burkii]